MHSVESRLGGDQDKAFSQSGISLLVVSAIMSAVSVGLFAFTKIFISTRKASVLEEVRFEARMLARDMVDFSKYLLFYEKYFYVDWDFAKHLNNNATFLQLKSITSFISPLISLCIPIIILILPFFILKINLFNDLFIFPLLMMQASGKYCRSNQSCS